MWYWAPLSSRNAENSGFREGDRTGGQRTINTALLQIPPGGDSKLCPVEEGPGSHEETQLIRRPPARRKSAGAEHQEAQSTYGTQEKSNCCNGEGSVWYISMRFCCDGDCSKRVGYQCHWFIFIACYVPVFRVVFKFHGCDPRASIPPMLPAILHSSGTSPLSPTLVRLCPLPFRTLLTVPQTRARRHSQSLFCSGRPISPSPAQLTRVAQQRISCPKRGSAE